MNPSDARWMFRGPHGETVAEIQAEGQAHEYAVKCSYLKKPQAGVSRSSNPTERRIRTGSIEIVSTGPASSSLKCHAVAVQHHSPELLVQIFGKAILRRGGEGPIEDLLREVDSRVQKVRLYPGPQGLDILVDIGLQEALPVSQVGQGMYRLGAIFSELIGEDPKILLIDEIENGIHHSMLEQVSSEIAAAAGIWESKFSRQRIAQSAFKLGMQPSAKRRRMISRLSNYFV